MQNEEKENHKMRMKTGIPWQLMMQSQKKRQEIYVEIGVEVEIEEANMR